jgi:hypothetical protein
MHRVLGLVAALLVGCFASSPAHAACTANAGTTIASAGTLTVDGCVSGGGNKIDFWKVALTGGDRVQVTVSSAVELDLYPPDTKDIGFIRVRPADVEVASPPRGSTQVLTIQAPFSATFVVAACQPVDYAANGGDCRGVFTDPGTYARSMQPYTVTSAALGNACASSPLRAGATIASAPPLPLGSCESGGGNDVDYWTVALNGGDQLQMTVPPASADVEFDLYPPGTTDDTLTRTTPTDSDLATTSQGVASPQVATLTASSAGTYVLAACEPKASATTPAGDCRGTRTGSAAGFVLPMKGYTFTSATIPQPVYEDTPYYPGSYDFGPYGDTTDYGSTYGKLSIAKQAVSVSKKGALRLTVRCAMALCNGTLKLIAVGRTTTGHGKKRKTRKITTTLAETELSYLDTGTTHVSLTLTKPGLRLLRHAHGRLRATATLRYDTDTASKTTRASITLRTP